MRTSSRTRTALPARRTALAGVAALALALSACGGGDDDSDDSGESGSDSADGDLTSITVGMIPISDVIPLYMGVEAGIFEEHGLDVELVAAQGGAAIIPAVLSGEYEFGYSNIVSLLIAHDTGLGIQVVSNGSTSTNVAGDDVTEVAATDESLQSISDLEGHTVAVNALNNFADTTIRAAMEAAGADPDTVEFVELPYPSMPAAIEAGDVDAAWTTEPFRTEILQAGGHIVASPMLDLADTPDSAYYFSSTELVESDPDLVESFVAALHESFELAMSDEEATRQAVIDFTDMDPDVAAEIAMSQFLPEINREGLEALAGAALNYGTISAEPDYDTFLGNAQ
ncbi:ABC-type nitrate/sulfonate/bicarbonate transport systems periplasmic components-like protein [Actinomycetales bacterium JB111]|nr:ABC-type nitrate/sulfonate/bicarbonate transport systems periplasmic components-like protein [Actinomycetales bacterium JB111]